MSRNSTALAQSLLQAITQEGEKLASISESTAETRHEGTAGWSRKQELGHLIDSATNNRVRFATAALARTYSGPTYDGDGWVKLGGYDAMSWTQILKLWTLQNQALAALINNISDEKLTVHCQVGTGPAVTLAFLIEDYILHMQHHLDHLLGREVSTSYPGAAMGV